MTSAQATGARSRRSDEKRQQIIAAAEKLFHEHGFQRVTMDQIHSLVGGSKRTLYSHFPSKDDLFRAIMEKAASKVLAAVEAPLHSGDIEEDLQVIGINYLHALLSIDAVALFRAVAAEGRHFPDLPEMFLQAGPQLVAQQLAAFFEAQRQKGVIEIEDTDLAAHQFLGMLRGNLHLLAIIGKPVSDSAIIQAVRQGVEVFLRGVKRNS